MRRAARLIAALSVLVLSVAQACTSREVVGVVVGGLGVQPRTATVYVGDSVQLSATVRDDRGVVVDKAQPTWTSSNGTIVAVGQDGTAWALRAGTAEVTAEFGGMSDAARIVVSPPPVFEFTVTETSGSTVVTEGGGTDQLLVVLLTQPADDVVIDVTSADPGEVSVDPASLTFTPADWNVPQPVELTGVDDPLVDGDQVSTVTLVVDSDVSATEFASAPSKTVEVLTRDDELPGFAVTHVGGGTTAVEGGAPDTIAVVLSVQPQVAVNLAVSVDDTTDATVSPRTLTFTVGDWNVPQLVAFTAVDDAVADGTRTRTVSVSVAAGSDPAFLELSPRTLMASTVDNEAVGFTVAHTGAGTVATEGGPVDSIVVTLPAPPALLAVFDLVVSDSADASVRPASLIFTSTGPTSQKVAFSAVDDPDLDGDRTHTVTVSVNEASDAAFLGLTPRTLPATTLDNDVAGFVILESGGVTTVSENGGTDTFTLLLSSRPASDVTLQIASADLTEAVVSPASVTFTRSTWDQPRTVTVAGVDDSAGDGDQATQITVSVAAGSDAGFLAVPPQSITATTVDDDGVGFTVGETDGTIVNESGTLSDAIVVSLNAVPLDDVVLEVTAADASEVRASPTRLTFTPQNGSQPQAVVVQGADDPTADGDFVSALTVSVNVALTLDPAYDTVTSRVVSVTTLDDEVPDILVSETGGGTSVEETGTTDAFTVVLGAQPVTNVVLTVASADVGEAVVDSATLTFTPTNWSTAKTVTVTGVEDGVDDGDQTTLVTVAVLDASSDDFWDALPDQTVSVTTLDVTAGFTVTESGGTTSVSESGTSDDFLVVLTEQPVSNVVLTVASADVGEVVADSATLTFTPANWNVAKTVTVTGVNDATVDGAQVTSVTLSVVAGSDPLFVGLPPRQVSVTTTDDDVADFVVTQTGGTTTVDESGTTDAFTVVLSAQPVTNVVLTVASADVGEAVVDSATLTFTPTNWSTAKTVTVTGVDDTVTDGPQSTAVTLSVAGGSDGAFAGLAPKVVNVTTTDDEIADFAITETQGSTVVTEGGSTDTFDVVLLSQPSSNVTIVASSPDGSEVTVSPASLTFRWQGNGNGAWNRPQTFTVTGVNDALADGDAVTLVVVAVDDATSDDVFDSAPDKTVPVTTLDDEVPGLSITESGGVTSVSENGSEDTFTVVLTAQPVSPVTVNVTSEDTGEVAVILPTISFTPQDWATPKTVRVAGVSDGLPDGPQSTEVVLVVDPASDPVYATAAPASVTVITEDID